jgi:hypothetical protein
VLYSVSRDKDVGGVTLAATPEATRRALVANGPVSVAPVDDEDVRNYAAVVDEFSIHDGTVVASHRAGETDAILTTDGAIRDADVDTVWE